MTTPDEILLREARISELATGFALNELTDDELRELHRALVDPTHGQAVARTAWRTLQTVTDLRAERSSVMQDMIRSRIADEAGKNSGITGRFLRHLGLRRPGLPPVAASAPLAARRWAWLLGGALALLLLITLAVIGWQLTVTPPVARVVSVVGRVTVGATTLGPSDPLDGRPISAASGAALILRWTDGSQAELIGPGTLIPARGGLALLGGVVHVTAASTVAVGLPDGQARAATGTVFSAEVRDGHSSLGCQKGVLDADGGPLSAGFARSAGLTYPWITADWSRLPTLLPIAGLGAWHLRLEAAPLGDGRVLFTWDDGSLSCDAQSVKIQQHGTPVVRAVHPPVAALIDMHADPSGWSIRLNDEEVLRLPNLPTGISTMTTGQVRLKARFSSGPAHPAQ